MPHTEDGVHGTNQGQLPVPAYLTNLCLLPCGRAPKLVKGNVKPLVDVSVDLVVLVTDLLRSQTFFQRLHASSDIDTGRFTRAPF